MTALADSATMLRRQLKHIRRYPTPLITYTAVPVVFLLLFVYVLGGTLSAGLGGNRAAYLAYLTPGILATTIAGAAQGTAIAVAMDMS